MARVLRGNVARSVREVTPGSLRSPHLLFPPLFSLPLSSSTQHPSSIARCAILKGIQPNSALPHVICGHSFDRANPAHSISNRPVIEYPDSASSLTRASSHPRKKHSYCSPDLSDLFHRPRSSVHEINLCNSDTALPQHS